MRQERVVKRVTKGWLSGKMVDTEGKGWYRPQDSLGSDMSGRGTDGS